MPDNGFFAKVYTIVKTIPAGKVMTYGQIAMLAGNPRAARAVGYAMSSAPEGLPCHRVVNRSGEMARGDIFGGRQKEILLAEGVPFQQNGTIDLKKCLWWTGL